MPCLWSFGLLFLDAVGAATQGWCGQPPEYCPDSLHTWGLDDEVALLQADLNSHSKMHNQEDQNSKLDTLPGKSKYKSYADGEKNDGKRYSDAYDGDKDNTGDAYGKKTSDYAHVKEKGSKYTNYHSKHAREKNYDRKSHASTYAKDKLGEYGGGEYGDTDMKVGKGKYSNYDGRHGSDKGRERSDYDGESTYGGDQHGNGYAFAKEKTYEPGHFNAKLTKSWKRWPKFKNRFVMGHLAAQKRNMRTLKGWMRAAQATPVDAHEYCSFYAAHFAITEGPDSTPITQHDCKSRIAAVFAKNTQRFENLSLTWIKPHAVIARFDMFWCTLPCAGRSVVCGRHPVRDTTVLFKFNKASHIRYQEWFYDRELLPNPQC